MKLKAYTLNGPATFTYEPVVWIKLQCTKDSIDLVKRFIKFLIDNEIFGTVPASSGGGQYSGGFTPEDAKRIKAWFLEQGAKHT